MNKENSAAAGAVLDEDHTLIPSDNIRINNNIQKAMQIIAIVSLIDDKIKLAFQFQYGKLKSGEEAIHISSLIINWEKLPFYTRK